MKNAAVIAKKKEDRSLELTLGLSFIRGFLHLLYNTAEMPDGLETMDQDGLLTLIMEAEHKLKVVEEIVEPYC